MTAYAVVPDPAPAPPTDEIGAILARIEARLERLETRLDELARRSGR